ncbi:MAG: hypothetical protein ACTHOE_12525 [Conexibacter sp.]
MSLRTLCVAAAVGLTATVGAVPAQARIVIGQGIAGVRIGDGQRHVRRVLGRPDRVIPPAWAYGAPLHGRVGFDHRRRVNDIWTTSRRQRTRAGVGPGSSVAAVRRAYRHARCFRGRHGDAIVLCALRSHRRGRTVETDFLFRRRQVKTVDVFLLMPEARPGPA